MDDTGKGRQGGGEIKCPRRAPAIERPPKGPWRRVKELNLCNPAQAFGRSRTWESNPPSLPYCGWSRKPESNWRSLPYQGSAFPLCYPGLRIDKWCEDYAFR